MSFLLRRIVFNRTASTQTITITRDISNVNFTDVNTYRNQPAVKQEVVNTATQFALVAGPDAAGADTMEVPGGWHSGGYGIDTFDRITGLFRDQNGYRMYFYRTTDGTFWDRIHIPRRTQVQAALWPFRSIYRRITKQQFDTLTL